MQKQMRNLAMERKILGGSAVDVSIYPKNEEGDYILPSTNFQEDMDYCDATTEEWIWSIGRNIKTMQVLASKTQKFYQNKEFVCPLAQITKRKND